MVAGQALDAVAERLPGGLASRQCGGHIGTAVDRYPLTVVQLARERGGEILARK